MLKFSDLTAKTHRLRLWHVIGSVVVLSGIVLGSYSMSFNSKQLNLSCQAKLYQSPFIAESLPAFSQTLALDVAIEANRAKLTYSYVQDGQDLAALIYRGKVSALEPGTMTYKLNLDQANLKMDLLQTEMPELMRTEVQKSRKALFEQGRMSFNMQIVDMDSLNDYVLIKFYPSGHLWACKSH
ncbi:hypothetical protein [Shewanella sp.]|uniref:hypothetical protein n=1 Tax=Shewanella sp. TaxID=50422 RepID=UPI003A85E6B6